MFGHQDEEQQTVNDQTATAEPTQTSWTAPTTTTTDSSVDETPTEVDTKTSDEVTSAPADPTPTVAATNDDLLTIKQQALSQLSPIVSHLDQSPEDRFRTLMMMIQASDNQSLIQTAYEAAQQITDEKLKAQALLDIVNEINYFTHQGQED